MGEALSEATPIAAGVEDCAHLIAARSRAIRMTFIAVHAENDTRAPGIEL